MSTEAEHSDVMAELDASGRKIVEMAKRLVILEAEVAIYRPPVVERGSEEKTSQP